MNDHRCKRIIKETAHVRQKQIIIIFHSKLEPVEVAKTLCYTKLCSSSSIIPKSANPVHEPSGWDPSALSSITIYRNYITPHSSNYLTLFKR